MGTSKPRFSESLTVSGGSPYWMGPKLVLITCPPRCRGIKLSSTSYESYVSNNRSDVEMKSLC